MVRRFLSVLAVCVLFVVPASAYSDSPPTNAPFTGSCYISCDTTQFGSIDIFLPVTYQSGYFSFDGQLYNVSNSSITGVFYDGGDEYSFRCSAWSTPQYREADGGYTWADLNVYDIEYSNVDIAEEFPPLVSHDTVMSYVPIALLGVIVLCLFMKRF